MTVRLDHKHPWHKTDTDYCSYSTHHTNQLQSVDTELNFTGESSLAIQAAAKMDVAGVENFILSFKSRKIEELLTRKLQEISRSNRLRKVVIAVAVIALCALGITLIATGLTLPGLALINLGLCAAVFSKIDSNRAKPLLFKPEEHFSLFTNLMKHLMDSRDPHLNEGMMLLNADKIIQTFRGGRNASEQSEEIFSEEIFSKEFREWYSHSDRKFNLVGWLKLRTLHNRVIFFQDYERMFYQDRQRQQHAVSAQEALQKEIRRIETE